ncbi:MAG: cytochrome c [bacterium]|nr:cytochrome c [bacterium]
MSSTRHYVISVFVLLPLISILTLLIPLVSGKQERAIGPSYDAPVEVSAGDAVNGEYLFRSKCYGCHVKENPNAILLDTADFKARHADDASIISIVRGGPAPMPAFNSQMLDDQEMADVIAYLRALP